MHLHVQYWIQHYGYFGIFLILFIEMVGVPFPAETTLAISGVEWTKGTFSLFRILAAAVSGNVLGASTAYGIGRFLGRPILVRFGKIVGITHERLDKADETLQKYRTKVLLFSRFIAGIRVLVPYLAGMNKMPFGLFTIYNVISSILWVTVFVVLGRYIGLAWEKYHAVMHRLILPGIVLLLVAGVLYFFFKRRGKKQK